MNNNGSMIAIDRLNASYQTGGNRVQVLHNIHLEVEKGEIFGLLGPNGAGKTTLLSCMEGLHRADSGKILIAGVDAGQSPNEAKRRMGIQLQRTALMDDLTAGELVEVYAALYERYLSREQVRSHLAEFGLEDLTGKYPRRMSGGQQQRLSLALAVVNDPQLVLLDEPTSQLDPHARRAMWETIRQMHTAGRTVLITTHSMEEAEALCGRVAILNGGRIIACDTPARLIAGLDAGSVLKIGSDLPREMVQDLPGVRMVRYSGQHMEIETSTPQETLSAVQALAERLGRRVGDVMLRQPNLEDVFLSLTGRSLETEAS